MDFIFTRTYETDKSGNLCIDEEVLSDNFYEHLIGEKNWQKISLNNLDKSENSDNFSEKVILLSAEENNKFKLNNNFRKSTKALFHQDIVSTAKKLQVKGVKQKKDYHYNKYDFEGLKIGSIEETSKKDPDVSKIAEIAKEKGYNDYTDDNKHDYTYKLTLAGEIIGFGIVEKSTSFNDTRYDDDVLKEYRKLTQIEAIYIRKEKRHLGLGTLLLNTIIKEKEISSVTVYAKDGLKEFYGNVDAKIYFLDELIEE